MQKTATREQVEEGSTNVFYIAYRTNLPEYAYEIRYFCDVYSTAERTCNKWKL